MTGIICIDKPENMTSFSAANRVRRLLGVKKTGHTGTLDPMATGVLVVALSNATRFIELLPVHNKSYSACVLLGTTTDTLDTSGKILDTSDVNVTLAQLEEACAHFRGEIMQIPPMYSAISKNGQRLYDLARQGIEVEREARPVTIHSLKITSFDNNRFSLDVSCSAGTYIRSLCDDIGKLLGCGACMSALRRTSANGFSLKDCVSLDNLEKAVSNNLPLNQYIKPVDSCFSTYDEITVSAAQAVRFANGGALSRDRLQNNYSDGIYRVYSPEKAFLGIGEIAESSDILAVRRVFVDD